MPAQLNNPELTLYVQQDKLTYPGQIEWIIQHYPYTRLDLSLE